MKIIIFYTFAVLFSVPVFGEESAEIAEREVPVALDLDNGFDAGIWGYTEFCPDDSFVQAIEVKNEPTGDVDNTAVNAIKLFCTESNNHDTGYITSVEGERGFWQGMEICSHGFVTGVRARVLPYQGIFDDDVAVTNVEVQCNHSNETVVAMPDLKYPKGEWGSWAYCPNNSSVCGLQVRYESIAIGDDCATTDFKLFCCDM